jgi:outer membrane protein TolC
MKHTSTLLAALIACGVAASAHAQAAPDVLTFARVIELATTQAPDAVTAGANVDVGRARIDSAGAALKPSITLSSSVSPSVQMTVPLLSKEDLCSANSIACSVGSVPVGTGRTGVSVDARWRLLDFGATGAAVAASEANLSSLQAKQQAAIARSVATALKTFVAVLADDELVVVRRRLAEDRARQAQVVKARAEVGAGSPSDVLQADVAAEAAALDLETALAQARTDRITLAGALGLDPEQEVVVDGRLDVDVAPDVATSAEAAPQHPDVKAADADVRSAEASVVRSERALWPTIDGTASVGTSLVALTTPSANFTPSVGVGLSLSWPLLDFSRRADIDIARATRIVAAATQAAQTTTVNTARARAVVSLSAQKALVNRATRLVASAQQAVNVVEERVKVGEGRLAELLDAQTALTTAEASLISVRATRSQAAIDVALASGVVDNGVFVR